MEKKKVAILSIKKNEITIKIKKKKRTYWSMSLLFLIAFTLCFAYGSADIKSIGISMSQIYNPVSSLYNDNSDVIFTNGILSGENLNFYVPMIANYEISEDGTIILEVNNSIMVKSTEAGIIEDVGITNNGVKYIKIKHSESIWSLVENVDIVGIEKNQLVKRGQDIATAKLGEKVYFQLFRNNIKISNLKIESTKIIWEN